MNNSIPSEIYRGIATRDDLRTTARLQLTYPEGVPEISPGLRRDAGRYPGKPSPNISPTLKGLRKRLYDQVFLTLTSFSLTPRFSEVYARCGLRLNRFSGFPSIFHRIFSCALVVLLLAFSPITHATTNDLTTLLQRGLFEEEANRNLDAAISNYQSLANGFDKDRQLAATAIFRLGECYRKLGRTNEAVAQYQRIIREFGDQQTVATLSQQNLAGLGATPQRTIQPASETQAASGSLQELQTLLTREKADYDQKQTLLDTLKKMSREDLRKALPTMVPDNQLNNLLSELDLAQQNLLQIKADYSPDHPKYHTAKDAVADLDLKIEDRLKGILVGLQAQLDASNAHVQWLKERIAEQSGGTQTAAEQQPPITDEEEKEIRRIQAMIQNSPDLINAASGDPRMTPLSRAASLGQLRVVRFLLEAKADINQRSGNMNPLQLAAWNGHRAMVELLLTNDADVNATDSDGRTALDLAAERGFVSVVETLLAAKADLNTQDSYGNTPLIHAVRGGHLAVAELLLAQGADSNLAVAGRSNYTPSESEVGAPLHFAVLQGDKPMVSLLLSNHADIELRNCAPYHETSLEIAAQGGRADIARLLLDAGANPNPEPADSADSPPLMRAAWRGDTNMVSLLLSKGADPNYAYPSQGGDTTALMAAVLNDHPETAMILLQNKADPNLKGVIRNGGSTAFWYGLYTSGAKSLIPLLEYGADPNQTNNYGASPLMGVANSGQFNSAADRLAVAKLLIEKGADVNAKDNDGETALHVAVLGNRPEMVELLLANKADVNVADKSGRTPLNIAIGSQRPQTPGPWMPIPLPRPLRNPPGTPPFEANNANPSSPKMDMVALLREHGALENLPNWNAIEIVRPSTSYSEVVFRKGTNDANQFSLLELLAVQYQFLASWPGGETGERDQENLLAMNDHRVGALSFPDLTHVRIRRPDATGKNWKEQPIYVKQLLESGACSNDVQLKWGDQVEIPESDHPLNERWQGFGGNSMKTFQSCLTRHIQIVVKGETHDLTLQPAFDFLTGSPPEVTTMKPFWILPVLRESNLLLASSDLSQIKVKRHDVAGKTHEWTVDCSDPNSPPNFWLRDGDVIEVPEKPE